MLKTPFSIAVFVSLAAILVKLGIFMSGNQHGDMERYIVFFYLLFLMLSNVFGARSYRQGYVPPELQEAKKKKSKHFKVTELSAPLFKDYFKSALATGVYFAIIMAAFTFYYYVRIDHDFFEIKFDEGIAPFKEYVIEQKEAFQNSPTAENKEALELAKENFKNRVEMARYIYTPGQQAIFTLMGLIFMGLLNSLVVALVYRKIPLKINQQAS